MTSRAGHVIVSGRWDDNVAVINVDLALKPENDATPKAVVSRPRVTPDLDLDGDGVTDAHASGQPVAVAVDADARFAYVVNHSGNATPEAAAAYQHGHPGLVTVLDVASALDPAYDDTLGAVSSFIDTGRTGPVGCALTPSGDRLLVNCGEAAGSEDGGDEVTVIDVASRQPVGHIPLAENRDHPATGPSDHDSPHPSFGRYPNPTGLVVSPLSGGLAFVGNGGFSDVSVIDLGAVFAGDERVEINRVPVETGPFGMAASPDGALVAVAARESMSEPYEGGTISIIDVERAAAGRDDAEAARVAVGGSDEGKPSRPFAVAFSPDGSHVIASCFRSNTISIVGVREALEGKPAELHRLHPTVPSGGPSRPRGIAVAGGRYAAVIGGPKSGPRSSLVWLLDLGTWEIVATVTEVGNESYFLAAVPQVQA